MQIITTPYIYIYLNSKLSKHDDEAQMTEVEILRTLNPNAHKKSKQTPDYDPQSDNGSACGPGHLRASQTCYWMVLHLVE